MKKNLAGLLAIALAVGFSAFRFPGKVKSPILIFQFNGANETEFQTAPKWQLLNNIPEILCDHPVDVKTVCILQVDQALASMVTNSATLTSYLQGLAIDTFMEIINAQAQGIDVVHVKERTRKNKKRRVDNKPSFFVFISR